MVGKHRPILRAFARSDRGAVLVEGLLALPIFLLACAVIIEFTVAVIQFNQTVKAVQIGARQLAVSAPLTSNFQADLTADLVTISAGNPVPDPPIDPDDIVRSECGAALPSDSGPIPACISGVDGSGRPIGVTRLVFGGDGVCNSAITRLPIGMCDIMPQIRPENVRVSYYRTGLGYVGRPTGPLPTITVQVVGLRFNFFLFDALLAVPALGGNTDAPTGINIPASPVTITGEDLCTTPPDPTTGRCPP